MNWIILAALAAWAVGMARKGRGKRMSGYVPLRATMNQGIGGIAAGAYNGFNLGDTALEPYWLSSVKATYNITDVTASEGPKTLIVAHSDYSDAEVAEWYNSIGAWDQGDLVAREQNSRRCRVIGTYPGLNVDEGLNDGRPVTTKLGWRCDSGQTLQFGLLSEVASTTGMELVIAGKVNAWRR